MRTTLACEFAKMRHLRVGLVAGVPVVAVTALTLLSAVTTPAFADASGRSWELLLAGLGLAVPVCAPLLLAILASRQVDLEHQGNGWLLAQSAGVTPGALCRAKFLALGAIVAAATALTAALVVGAGLLLGLPLATLPLGAWIGTTAAVLVVDLVVLAVHVLLATRVTNQLVGLGVGVLGTALATFAGAMPAALAAATPWGWYAAAAAADYCDGTLVALTPDYLGLVALAVVGAALAGLATAHLDRQEV